MDNAKREQPSASEGGRTTPEPRPVQYPAQLVLRLDVETMTALKQDAKENNRTVAQTARGWLWRARDDARRNLVIDLTYHAPAEQLERETFEDSP